MRYDHEYLKIALTILSSDLNHVSKEVFTMLEKIKDPGSAITHFIGMLMAMFAATPLIIKSLHEPDYIHVISLTVFIVSMILLYAASTIYHTLNLSERTNRILRKLDHSICLLYTSFLTAAHGSTGYETDALHNSVTDNKLCLLHLHWYQVSWSGFQSDHTCDSD